MAARDQGLDEMASKWGTSQRSPSHWSKILSVGMDIESRGGEQVCRPCQLVNEGRPPQSFGTRPKYSPLFFITCV